MPSYGDLDDPLVARLFRGLEIDRKAAFDGFVNRSAPAEITVTISTSLNLLPIAHQTVVLGSSLDSDHGVLVELGSES